MPPSDNQNVTPDAPSQGVVGAEPIPVDPLLFSQLEEELAGGNASPDSGSIVAQWSIEDQQRLAKAVHSRAQAMGSTGWGGQQGMVAALRALGALEKAVKRDRANAFREGRLLPGVDPSGGGTGLSKDKIRGILAGRATTAAETIRENQPGLESYQHDTVMDPGAGSVYDKLLADENAWLDENIEAYDPVLEGEAIRQERSDTTGLDAQLASLGDYDDIIGSQGLTATDRARIEEMRADTARRARAQEEAIMADAAERGRATGASSLLLRNQAQQAAMNERALGDMRTSALGLERKDAAIRNRGFLGGDVQVSQDSIDRFNTENSIQTRRNDIDRQNKAGGTAWDLEQTHRAENVGTRQAAIGADHAEDTARTTANTNRQNEQEAANDAGARQHWGDQMGALGSSYNFTQTGPAYNNAASSHQSGGKGQNPYQAAGQGVIAGAAAGSEFGPKGAVVGGVAGGLLGYFGRQKAPKVQSGW